MVTQEMLARLRAQRQQPKAQLVLTPATGMAYQVNRQILQDRERQISQGEQTLNIAQEQFKRAYGQSTQAGRLKAAFQPSQKELTP